MCSYGDGHKRVKITNLYLFDGLKRVPVEHADMGYCSGIRVEGINIGDTICDTEHLNPCHLLRYPSLPYL